MKKKEKISSEDQKIWASYIKKMEDIYDKDAHLTKKKNVIRKVRTIDLHGLSLENANKTIKKFIDNSLKNNYLKIKVITGKGLRSKLKDNPYASNELSVLKNSVPEFIRNEKDLLDKIYKIYPANPEEGGEGAFYILLKNFKE